MLSVNLVDAAVPVLGLEVGDHVGNPRRHCFDNGPTQHRESFRRSGNRECSKTADRRVYTQTQLAPGRRAAGKVFPSDVDANRKVEAHRFLIEREEVAVVHSLAATLNRALENSTS